MWAWVRTRPSTAAASKGKGCRLRSRTDLLPWNIPQSIRSFADSVFTRELEPVTVPAAPQKVRVGMVSGSSRGGVPPMIPPGPDTSVGWGGVAGDPGGRQPPVRWAV